MVFLQNCEGRRRRKNIKRIISRICWLWHSPDETLALHWQWIVKGFIINVTINTELLRLLRPAIPQTITGAVFDCRHLHDMFCDTIYNISTAFKWRCGAIVLQRGSSSHLLSLTAGAGEPQGRTFYKISYTG